MTLKSSRRRIPLVVGLTTSPFEAVHSSYKKIMLASDMKVGTLSLLVRGNTVLNIVTFDC